MFLQVTVGYLFSKGTQSISNPSACPIYSPPHILYLGKCPILILTDQSSDSIITDFCLESCGPLQIPKEINVMNKSFPFIKYFTFKTS